MDICRTNVLDLRYNDDLQSALNLIARELRDAITKNPYNDIVVNGTVKPFLYFKRDSRGTVIKVQCPDMASELRAFLENPVVVVREHEPTRTTYPLVDRLSPKPSSLLSSRDVNSYQVPSLPPSLHMVQKVQHQSQTPSLMPHQLEWVKDYEQQHGNPDNDGHCSLGQLSRAIFNQFGLDIGTKTLGRILAEAGLR